MLGAGGRKSLQRIERQLMSCRDETHVKSEESSDWRLVAFCRFPDDPRSCLVHILGRLAGLMMHEDVLCEGRYNRRLGIRKERLLANRAALHIAIFDQMRGRGGLVDLLAGMLPFECCAFSFGVGLRHRLPGKGLAWLFNFSATSWTFDIH